MRILIHIIVFCLLTIVTQVGGIIYLISILLIKKKTNKNRLKRLAIFSVLYLITTYLIVPKIAPLFGREKIKETELIDAKFFFFTLANRNYVRPELNKSLQSISIELNKKHKGIKLIYLDANFPFIDGFPLLPHLSHNDGKKIDVSLIYEESNRKITNKKPSISGYGAFEEPTSAEYNQISVCKKKGYWQYDFPKYLTLGTINTDIKFSNRGTQDLANLIVRENSTGKLFIEPHLKTRLNLTSSKVRFHGCRAVRHDDHIHFQLK